MCLVTYECTPKVADKDIVTYKIVERIYPKRGSLDAFIGIRFKAIHYREQKYAPNILYTATCFRRKLTRCAKGHDPKINKHCVPVYCTEGGFYSYENFEDAMGHMNYYRNAYYSSRLAIIKCVIPKGTEYYVSAQPHIGDKGAVLCSALIKVTAYMNNKKWITK